MARVLVVEYELNWQIIHQDRLERILGVGVDCVDNYTDAVSILLNQLHDAYILNDRFSRTKGGNPEELWFYLTQEIRYRGISYDRIAIVSDESSVLAQALKLGITNTYKKWFLPDEKTGERCVASLIDDLEPLLISETARRYPALFIP